MVCQPPPNYTIGCLTETNRDCQSVFPRNRAALEPRIVRETLKIGTIIFK